MVHSSLTKLCYFSIVEKHDAERIDPALLFDYSKLSNCFGRCTKTSGNMALNGVHSIEVINITIICFLFALRRFYFLVTAYTVSVVNDCKYMKITCLNCWQRNKYNLRDLHSNEHYLLSSSLCQYCKYIFTTFSKGNAKLKL